MTNDRILSLLQKMAPVNAALCLSRMENPKAIEILEMMTPRVAFEIMGKMESERADCILLECKVDFVASFITNHKD